MPEGRVPTTFRQHLGMVIRRSFAPFAWARDLVIATIVAVASVAIQAHKHLIPDWSEHWKLWLLSYLIPYAGVLVLHSLYRLAEAPWRVHQQLEAEHWQVQNEAATQLTAAQSQNALLQDRISNQTWPEKRPRITFDRWGQQEIGGVAKSIMGFYLTNHGDDAALEVIIEPFAIDGKKWISNPLSAIEARQKGFVVVWMDGHSPQEGYPRWMTLSVRSRDSFRVHVRYRDFNNNWYRTAAPIKITGLGLVDLGSSTQEKLGSS